MSEKTLRDEFAVVVLMGLLQKNEHAATLTREAMSYCTAAAYSYADEMLKARELPKP